MVTFDDGTGDGGLLPRLDRGANFVRTHLIVKDDSNATIKGALTVENSYDLVNGEYVDYFRLIKPHLTPKCLIAADNITSHAEKVQTFVDAVDNDDEFQYEILELPGGLLVAFRG